MLINPLLLSGKMASSRKWKWQHCNSLRMWSVEWSAFVDCKRIDTNTWQNDGTTTSNWEKQAKKTGGQMWWHKPPGGSILVAFATVAVVGDINVLRFTHK
jgi:hypothetical protein